MDKPVETSLPTAENVVSQGTKEIVLDNGDKLTFPTINIGKIRLFHGSPVPGISELTDAEETTVGSGVYLTSEYNAAAGYALVRANRTKNPIVYETEISDIELLDLTKPETLHLLAPFIRQEVLKWKKRMDERTDLTDTQRYISSFLPPRIIEMIDNTTYLNAKDLLFNIGDLARTGLSQHGFDGIKTLEGGEGGSGIWIGNHDSFVIFDPAKVKIASEAQIASHLPGPASPK